MPQRFLVHDVPAPGPATHAIVIGVGAYPHLLGGTGTRTADHDGMAQLTSPPLSARRLAKLIEKFRDPTKPLSSVSLLLSEKEPKPFVAPNGAESAVETANADNVTAAIKDWFNRANTDFQNLMLFFFCGHGISAGTETALLMSDYGADPLSALDGAINFRLLRLATQQCRATEQCFIVDACRASSDTLVSAEFAGRVVIRARPRIPTWPPRRFPVFYASSKGDKAYGFPDQPTAYTNALLKTLDHFGGDDEEGDWRVGTHRIRRVGRALGVAANGERSPEGAGSDQRRSNQDPPPLHERPAGSAGLRRKRTAGCFARRDAAIPTRWRRSDICPAVGTQGERVGVTIGHRPLQLHCHVSRRRVADRQSRQAGIPSHQAPGGGAMNTIKLSIQKNLLGRGSRVGAVASLRQIDAAGNSLRGNRIEVAVPANRDGNRIDIPVDPGRWLIEATMPSGEIIAEEVVVPDVGDTFDFRDHACRPHREAPIGPISPLFRRGCRIG